jgi:acyl-CoA synthetase (AMP-forming)/AMP-acid ligase II
VNRDGLLVPFSEVEQVIETLAGIESVIVEAQGESQRGKGLVAYCVMTKGTTLSEVEIRAFCFKMLPKYAIPDRVVILKALPLLQNGKVDRQKIMSMTAEDAMNLARG